MRVGAISILVVSIIMYLFCVGAQAAEIKRYDVSTEASPSIGPENAEITIIEFIDYQ